MGQAGYDGYYSSYDDGPIAGFEFMGGIGGTIHEGQIPLPYVPDLAPVGSGNSYFPRSVDDDAVALNVLGFQAGTPEGGISLRDDQRALAGAWDPQFQAAVRRFQASTGGILVVDGWIGPKTRTALAAAVAKFNTLASRPGALPPPAPPPLVPSLPGLKPASNKTTPPAVAVEEPDHTGRNIAIAAGVLAALAGGYYLLK